MEERGSTRTRANGVRPLDARTRTFHRLMAFWLIYFGASAWLFLLVPFLFRAEEVKSVSVGDMGDFFFGTVLIVWGFLHAVMYLADCVSRWALSKMSPSQLRRRLAKADRTAAYTVKRVWLRSAYIAAWFFGLLVSVSLVGLLVRWMLYSSK